MSPIKTDKPAENLGFQFLNGFEIFGWNQKIPWEADDIFGPTFGVAGGRVVQLEKKKRRLVKVGPAI